MNDTVVSSRAADASAGVEVSPPPAGAGVAPSGREVIEEVVIRPRRGWIAIDWAELYRYRELLYFLVWRDIKVRYKQTVLGVAWAVLVPLLSMVVFTIIFDRVANLGARLSAGMEGYYELWAFAGLVPWLLFQTAMSDGGMSLVNQQHLLTKIYLPRLFVPAAVIGRALVDMGIAWLVFIGLMLYFQAAVSWTIVLAPLLIVPTILTALGAAYTLAALSVTYRDFRFIIPFMAQMLMFLSFVAIPLEMVPLRFQPFAAVNPMLGIVEAYRSAIFADVPWNLTNLAVSTASAVVLFVFGLFFFRKAERRFADIA